MSEIEKKQNDELSEIENEINSYNQGGEKKSSNKMSSEELKKKYFKLQNAKETFRVLPKRKNQKSVFETAFFHEVTMLTSGGKKQHGVKIYCPAHNSPKIQKLDAQGNPVFDEQGKPVMIPQPCPLCAKAAAIESKIDPNLKYKKKDDLTKEQQEERERINKEASKWKAKEFAIVKGIDRGMEKDGPKFWRFKIDNYRKQGPLDKLMPIITAYTESTKCGYYNAENGTDFLIMCVDSEFNGLTYKSISGVIAKGPSPLHSDPVVAAQWINDPLTWRDVFKPKSAPNVTEQEVLTMIANGSNPYWDTTDEKNKHWVFPGRPDLEELANTRNQDLDGGTYEKEIKMASDIDYIPAETQPRPSISNMTSSKVGTFVDDAEAFDGGDDIDDEYISPSTATQTGESTSTMASNSIEDDDLPF